MGIIVPILRDPSEDSIQLDDEHEATAPKTPQSI